MDYIDTIIGRPNTIKTYRCLYNKWLKVDFPNIQDYIKYWESEDLSRSTIKILTRLLVGKVQYETGKQLDQKTIMRMVQVPSSSKKMIVLNASQFKNLTMYLWNNDQELYWPVLLAGYTGMRKGEVFGLRWEDMDFDSKIITVSRSYNGPTKNGKTRIIPMHQHIHLNFSFKKGDNSIEDEKVIEEFKLNHRLKNACVGVNIPKITFHALRHGFATLALEAGRSPKEVQEVLGHSKVSTTLDTYWRSIKMIDINFI